MEKNKCLTTQTIQVTLGFGHLRQFLDLQTIGDFPILNYIFNNESKQLDGHIVIKELPNDITMLLMGGNQPSLEYGDESYSIARINFNKEGKIARGRCTPHQK